MKYIRFIILILIFSFVVYFINQVSKKHQIYSSEMLKNDVEFEGRITYIKTSQNHAFGIIGIEIIKSNLKKFENLKLNEYFPYKIRNNYAEIYCTVNVDRKNGEIIKIISNESTIYYNPKFSNEIGDLHLVSDETDKKFIEKYSKIKD
jgi:hypothetical protein